jgi:hypothetical protein
MTDATVTLRSQVVNGYFSTVNEKIRVSNSTGNPQWTLTLAANNGATAFWHGLSRDYDYNDASTTVIDGSDIDNLSGRLSLNPSIASLSGTCTTTGMMKGSSAGFSE